MEKRSVRLNSKFLATSIFLALGLAGCTDAPIKDEQQTQAMAKYQLRWTPPVERVDGSALSEQEIAGYQIKWTLSTTGNSDIIEVDATLTSYLAELDAGDYEFEIAAIDKTGRLSRFVKPQ